jgi:hypothetical protein
MTPKNIRNIELRTEALRAEMDGIGAMLNGALLVNHNRTKRKDGSVYTSPEHYTFQYYGVDGKRRCLRIPKNAKAAVERLIRAGNRYRALEREYAALSTEVALANDSKKNA